MSGLKIVRQGRSEVDHARISRQGDAIFIIIDWRTKRDDVSVYITHDDSQRTLRLVACFSERGVVEPDWANPTILEYPLPDHHVEEGYPYVNADHARYTTIITIAPILPGERLDLIPTETA